MQRVIALLGPPASTTSSATHAMHCITGGGLPWSQLVRLTASWRLGIRTAQSEPVPSSSRPVDTTVGWEVRMRAIRLAMISAATATTGKRGGMPDDYCKAPFFGRI